MRAAWRLQQRARDTHHMTRHAACKLLPIGTVDMPVLALARMSVRMMQGLMEKGRETCGRAGWSWAARDTRTRWSVWKGGGGGGWGVRRGDAVL